MRTFPPYFLALSRRLDERDWPDSAPWSSGDARVQPHPPAGPPPPALYQQILEERAAADAADEGAASCSQDLSEHRAYPKAAFQEARRRAREERGSTARAPTMVASAAHTEDAPAGGGESFRRSLGKT